MQTDANTSKIERRAFTLHEVADALGIHYSSVWRLVARGKLRTVGGLKRNRLIPAKELDRFLRSFDEEVGK